MSAGMILSPNTPIKFEARNFRPFYKRLRAGDFYGGNFEFDEETWQTLKTIPENTIITVLLYYNDGDPVEGPLEPKPEKKEKAVKGPHGKFWQGLFKKGFLSNPVLIQILDDNCHAYEFEKPEPKELLHLEFEVESLAEVGPEKLREWLAGKGSQYPIDSALLMIEQAERQVA